MLYTASKILGRERGEDAVHDVFEKIIERFNGNFQNLGDKPSLYFVIMVKNHSLNIMQKEKMETVPLEEGLLESDIFQSSELSPEANLLNNEAVDNLTVLIRQLSPKLRMIFEYRYIEGYTNIEIAELLGISQSSVSTAINKAKTRLKELIGFEGA
jgi:RNA polymerase sigma-70 factor (ECF subfamily)